MARTTEPVGGGFLGHLGFVGFLALYFAALLLWFGWLFLGGGAEEHAVMSVVIPVVGLIGLLTVFTLSRIVLEGRRATRERRRAAAAAAADPGPVQPPVQPEAAGLARGEQAATH